MMDSTQAVLDIEQGIARLMGNSRIYFNALKRFGIQIAAAHGIAEQLAAGDHAGAQRTIHTLKGTAGLLGAGEVQALAIKVEAALTGGDTAPALLDELAAALDRVQARIDTAVAESAPPPQQREAMTPPEDINELLDRLAALFDEGNGAAIDLLEQWESVLEEAVGQAAWQAVARAAYDYDFESALAALESARRPD
ncbi:Hpt domain-containing protein [Pseudoduganella flava]|uniref:Phosphotransfer domain-containing protein n=2 Tax=Pseudoduganella flava TaxID=871742 RepID=A0ABX6FU94_9BURK|nr:Hpt domain-containing protein [Pseudoduganella flava]QGZ40132.1 phosphotransfer domain-containing protein [Pseudoduganella flava]